jgi:hypothetical protein
VLAILLNDLIMKQAPMCEKNINNKNGVRPGIKEEWWV